MVPNIACLCALLLFARIIAQKLNDIYDKAQKLNDTAEDSWGAQYTPKALY